MNFSFQLKEFLILALLCCALFVGACWVQSSYLSYFDYMPWASLFFLPAGVKLIAFIVARGAGFWGVSAGTSLTLHLDKSWNPPEIHDYVTSFEFFCLFPFLGILLIQKLLKIKADLVGMTELQVILLVVLGALVNGVSINIYMFIESMISMQDVGVGILATTFGYVTGIAFLMFVISLGTGIKRSVLKG